MRLKFFFLKLLILVYEVIVYTVHLDHSRPKRLQKSRPKKTREIKSNKSISRNFTLRKWKISKKKFREIDSFHLTSFLAWNFLNFLAYCATTITKIRRNSMPKNSSNEMNQFHGFFF